MVKKIILIIVFFSISECYAQDTTQKQIDALKSELASLKSGEKSHFMIRGFAQFGLDATSDNVNFNMTSFNPVLLWRLSDRLLFESEIEMEYMDNQFSLNLGYANISYIITKGLVIKVGKILVPFGVFGEKLHPSWINKFADMPLGLGHDNGMLPMADIGVELRGGFQIGKSKLSYSVYAVNGPRIKDGTAGQTEAGMLSYENATDNNNNKALGTRIGFLPLSNSSLEVGFSAYYAKPGSATSPFANDPMYKDISYKDINSLLYAVDLSYVKMVSPIKGTIDIKAQYNVSKIDDATYLYADTTLMTRRYTFKNNSTAYYAQLAYRPSMASSDFLKNIEFVGRYSVYTTPEGSLWYNKQTQMSFGINYWLSWRTVLKIGYQITDGVPVGSDMSGMGSTGSMNMGTSTIGMFQIHLATGL